MTEVKIHVESSDASEYLFFSPSEWIFKQHDVKLEISQHDSHDHHNDYSNILRHV
jgi:hypothetical protein